MDYDRPNEKEIQRIMEDTGMSYMQAYRHAEQRRYIQAAQRQNPPRNMGKSSYDD